MNDRLFPEGLPEREWVEFEADGFSGPVTGAIYRGTNPPNCGLPLGGIDTGCLDLDVTGVLGYCTIFNSLFPRRGPMRVPFLGINVGHQTWVLTTLNMQGYTGLIWSDDYHMPWRQYMGIRTASEIDYWGHYPVADLEYVTDAPVSVGLRAWTPFLPGDVGASNTPGSVFEVRLRNTTEEAQEGSLAFSFPGPTEGEAGTTSFGRREVDGGGFHGVSVESEQSSYALGVVGPEELRVGGELGMDETAWAIIEHRLPYASRQAGATAAVDFSLAAGEEKVVRYVLAWYSPVWMGSGSMMSGGNAFTHMYASRYEDAVAVAEYLARDHESLLKRTLAWQEAIQRDPDVPPWLRDSLANILHLIPETSTWAQAKPPIDDWCRPEDGIFALNESPRSCPDQEILCNSFFGNAPIVYFYPELAMSSLRAYKANQFPSGQAPWMLGGVAAGDPPSPPFDLVSPATGFAKPMTTLDGPCYVDMVDRMWMRTGDDAVLREFYESIKKNTVFTMNLRPGSGAAGIVSMPANNDAQVWVEGADLFGIVPHIGGVHLAQLRTAKRMAEAMGDSEFARQCQEWIEQGSDVLEEHAWAGTHYVLYNELETGKRSDVVLSAQLEGEWMTLFHGLEGVFRPDRVETTLETIKNTSVALSEIGAVAFSEASGVPLEETDWNPGYWGSTGEHVPSTFMLAATYMYKGQRELGLEVARRTVDANMRRGAYWDWPSNMFPMPFPPAPDGGPVHVGLDYMHGMSLWLLPAAMVGKDLTGPCAPGGLADRVLQAAH